jgi:hypothetical protein
VKLNALRGRLPHQREILYVFGGVVFLIYSWAIRGFLYQFSSLRLYHTLGEIFGVFSYLMAFALLETLVIMGILILIGLILPGNWLREGFAYKGFITTLVTGIAMIFLNNYLFSLNHAMPPKNAIPSTAGITFVLLISLIWVFQNIPELQKFLLAVQERMQIFIYFYIPLGILGLAVVVLRNLL